jgi:hypothetical protein
MMTRPAKRQIPTDRKPQDSSSTEVQQTLLTVIASNVDADYLDIAYQK